jgi:Putative metallopeptidase
MICREMVDELYQLFALEKVNRTKINQGVEGTLVSVLLHELGRALIHPLDLPVTGREEDAADQLSSLLLINRTV